MTYLLLQDVASLGLSKLPVLLIESFESRLLPQYQDLPGQRSQPRTLPLGFL